MNVIRCRKCGASVFTDTTMEERFFAEKEELHKKFETFAQEKLFARTPKHKKQLGAEMDAVNKRLAEVNIFLKQFKHLARMEERATENEFMTKVLRDELYSLGVSQQRIRELGELSREKREAETRQIRAERERLYADAGRASRHNEWHGVSGQYDPTAKTAIDNTRGW